MGGDKAQWVRGWVVYRNEPRWEMKGFFKTETEARQLAATLDSSWRVRYGNHRLGTDDAIFADGEAL